MRIIGLDVGFSKNRPTSGVALLDQGTLKVGCATSDWNARRRVLGCVRDADVAAVDAPIVPRGRDGPRAVERLLSAGRFQRRCKPGASHVPGTGQQLRSAGQETANQLVSVTSGRPLARTFPRVEPECNIVEAFPNAFLGVCVDQNVYEQQPKLKRGKKFDWLYQHWVDAHLFDDLCEILSINCAALPRACNSNRHHEERAGLACLLTAASVATGEYVAIGEESGGYFFLPPWRFWATWARDELDRQRQRFESIEVWIDGETHGHSDPLPSVPPLRREPSADWTADFFEATDSRSRSYPENRFQADGPREVDANARLVLDLYPEAVIERTRDAIQLEIDGETGIVLLVTKEALEIRLPTLEWTGGTHSPAAASRLWRRLEWNRVRNLSDQLDEAFLARKSGISRVQVLHRALSA